ncbi:MAG: AsmA family protein [Gammaproteobacteria bacterium]
MARPFKIFLAIIGGLVALVVLAVVVVSLVFNPNDYKGDAAKAARDQTGRELDIKGDIKLTFYPWLGARIEDVQLENREGFGPGPMMKVSEMNVGVRLMPLLFKKRVEVAKVRIDGLALNLEKKADGTNNWEDIGDDQERRKAQKEADEEKAKEAAKKPRPPQGQPMAVYVGGVDITNVAFSYKDAQTGEAYAIDKLSLQTGPIEKGRPLDVVIAFIVNSAKPQLESDVKIAFTALTDVAPEVTEIKDIRVDTESRGPAVPGGKQAATLRGEARHDHGLGSFSFRDGVLTAGALTLNAVVEVAGLNTEVPALSGRISTNTFNPKDVAASFGVVLPPTADPGALTAASFAAGVAGDPKNVKLNGVTLKLDQTTATGGLVVRNLSDPQIDLALKADTFDADRYMAPPIDSAPAQDGASGDFKNTPIPVEILDSVNATGTIDLASLKLKGVNFSDIHITLDAPKGQPKLQEMTALLYGGRITQSARFTHNSPVKYDMKVGLDAVNSAPLLKDMLGKSLLSGLGNFDLTLNSGGETVGAFLAAMNGGVGASFRNGAIEGFNLDQTLGNAKAMLKGEPAPAAAADQPKRTEFKDLSAAGKIVDGVLDTDKLDIKGSWYQLGGDGRINLVEQTVNYTLLPSMSGDKHKDLKGVKVPVAITGSWYAPKVKVDLKGMLKGQAREEIKQQEEKVKEKARSKLDDFLKKQLAPKPAPPPPPPPEEPKTEAPPPGT